MGTGPVTGCVKGERDIAGLRTQRNRQNRAESSKQQPRGNGKPVGMEWGTVGQSGGTWPWEVRKMP